MSDKKKHDNNTMSIFTMEVMVAPDTKKWSLITNIVINSMKSANEFQEYNFEIEKIENSNGIAFVDVYLVKARKPYIKLRISYETLSHRFNICCEILSKCIYSIRAIAGVFCPATLIISWRYCIYYRITPFAIFVATIAVASIFEFFAFIFCPQHVILRSALASRIQLQQGRIAEILAPF